MVNVVLLRNRSVLMDIKTRSFSKAFDEVYNVDFGVDALNDIIFQKLVIAKQSKNREFEFNIGQGLKLLILKSML